MVLKKTTDITKEELFSTSRRERQTYFAAKRYTLFGIGIYRTLILIVPIGFCTFLLFLVYGSQGDMLGHPIFLGIILGWLGSLVLLFITKDIPPIMVQFDGISQGKTSVYWGKMESVQYHKGSGTISITRKDGSTIKMALKRAKQKVKEDLGYVLKLRCESKNIPISGDLPVSEESTS